MKSFLYFWHPNFTKEMIRIGVIGTGHLGKIHLQLLKNNPNFELVGFFDIDKTVCEKVAHDFQVPFYNSIEDLISSVDAVDIVTPTPSHFEIAKLAITQLKHVFIEKPVTETLEQAKYLSKLVQEADVIAQVGHVERFNPALLAIKGKTYEPVFLEVHRLAQWNPRGTDVSVVLDLMIHDIDIILSLVKSTVKKVFANGVSVISDTPDIANARIEFHNGTVANLTASRISMKNMRKLRFFQKNAYISVDFLDKKTEIINIHENETNIKNLSMAHKFEFNGKTKYLEIEYPNIPAVNSIGLELEDFAKCIQEKSTPKVSIDDGYKALSLAYQVIESIGNYAV